MKTVVEFFVRSLETLTTTFSVNGHFDTLNDRMHRTYRTARLFVHLRKILWYTICYGKFTEFASRRAGFFDSSER